MSRKLLSPKSILLLALSLLTVLITPIATPAQGSRKTAPALSDRLLTEIIEAEDKRTFTPAIAALLKHRDPAVRSRAALAAGRIGDESAIEALSTILLQDPDQTVRAMAAFAIGEIESLSGAGAAALLSALGDSTTDEAVQARAVEAYGKLAAAAPQGQEARARSYAATITALLAKEAESTKPRRDVTQLALTAALRARATDAGPVIAKFLEHPDARTRADAANTLARLRIKVAG